MSCTLKHGTVIIYVDDSETKNEVQTFQDMKKKDETLGEMNHGASHRQENKLLVKGLTHSGSGVLCVALVFSLYFDLIDHISNLLLSDCSVKNEEKLAKERGKTLDLEANQEMDLQRKEGLQVLQEMNRKEERPEEYPLMHTAATRGVL